MLIKTVDAELGLIAQAQQGDRNAFGELVRRHYENVVQVVYRMCGEAQLAEDAAQEAFLRAWIHLPSFEPRANLRNWLYRIAINAALDILRRKSETFVEDEERLMVSDQTPGPEETLIRKEQAALLQQALRSLPEASRSVLILREYGELSYQEIAGVLDIPIGTVMSRLNYARNRLRQALQNRLPEMENAHA